MNRGRPSKLTPETQARVVKALRQGCTRTDAARYAGVCEAAFWKWMARGRAGRGPRFVEFLQAVLAAEGHAARRMAAIIHRAAPDDWRAAAWWLERRRRKQFGRVQRLQVTGKGEGPIRHEHAALTDEQRLRALEALYARLGRGPGGEAANGHAGGDRPLLGRVGPPDG